MTRIGKLTAAAGCAGLMAIGAIGMGFGPSSPTSVESVSAEFAAADSYAIDPVHTGVLFRINHAGAGVFWGRFNEVSGTFQIDPDDLSASFFKVTVPVGSVDTNNEKRDQHLASGDFFNARQNPTAIFESTGMTATDEASVFELKGNLTMFGETKPIAARLLYNGEGAFQGKKTKGFEVEFTIKRAAFGNTTFLAPDGSNTGGIGNDVKVIVAGEGAAR